VSKTEASLGEDLFRVGKQGAGTEGPGADAYPHSQLHLCRTQHQAVQWTTRCVTSSSTPTTLPLCAA
jgi:hypothetical protein